jgi:pyrimidine-specific ribonucleoside hydrolase
MKRTSSVLVAVLLVAACGSDPGVATTTTAAPTTTPTLGDPRTPVIFDYSPTVSDVGALVFLATHPDLRLIAVTLPGPGESHCEFGVAHTRGALVALGLGDIPVSCGVDSGYGDLYPFPTEWRRNADTIDLPEAEPNDERLPADLIADLIVGSAVPVEIVAVGPLTNLALLLDDYPEVVDGIAGITIMGGAVDVPGNVPLFAWGNANEHAEVNFWVDPAAAARVMASGVPITLVPLDATDYLPADAKFQTALLSTPSSTASQLLGGVWQDAPEWSQGGLYLWDELAAAILADESIVEFETRTLVVDVGDDAVAGWSREDPAGEPVRVAVSADRVAFETLFLTTVLGRPVSIDRLVATAEERAYFAAVSTIGADFEAAQEAIFAATAEALGLDGDDSEEAYFEVLLSAVPVILSGPMTEYRDALDGVVPPGSLAALHVDLVVALDDLLLHQEEVLSALQAAVDSGDDAFEFELPYLPAFMEACRAMSVVASNRGVNSDLGC